MISINNISFSYGDHVIFDNASCSIPSKGVFLLRGDNGIGKSTLFKILIGELKLQSGNIKIQDITLDKSTKKENVEILKNNISYISQENNFIDFLNAEDNASLNKLLKNQKAEDLTLLKHDSYAKRTINQLSTGEKVLISLQRALNENKKILLLDECSDFLDAQNTNLLIKKIDEISKNHLVIIISHDQRIIDYYNKVILIKNNKISCSFSMNNDDKLEELNKNKEKKSLITLIKKFIKKQKLVSILMVLILSLFNSLIFSFTSVGTYSFKEAFQNSINLGYYSFKHESENIYIEGINISELFGLDSSLTSKEIKKVDEKFNVKYYGSSCSSFIVSKYGKPNGKIKLSRNQYKRSKIIDDKVLIKFHEFKTSILMPYEIDYNVPFEYYPFINIEDFNNLKYSDSITISCGIWENDKMRFSTEEGLKQFFSTNSRVAYISPSLFEEKYNVKLPYEIDDNSIYISNQLLRFKTEQNVKFFNFNNYDLKEFENFFLDLNNVFSSETKLYHDESFASLLEANEVIISENNFAKISKCISYLDNPFVYINDSNRNAYINYLYDNNLEVYSIGNGGEYSIHVLYVFKDKYYNDYWFYLIIFALFLVVELSIIYIYAVSFKKKNKDNIRILKSYLSHNKNTFFFTIPFLIYQILTYIISFIISLKLLEILTNSLEYNIFPLHMNFASAFITLLINGLIYAFVYFIIKSQRKINE